MAWAGGRPMGCDMLRPPLTSVLTSVQGSDVCATLSWWPRSSVGEKWAAEALGAKTRRRPRPLEGLRHVASTAVAPSWGIMRRVTRVAAWLGERASLSVTCYGDDGDGSSCEGR